MSITNLPSFILNSIVLTTADKELLLSAENLPTEAEVDEIRNLPEILELTNAFIGDDTSRDTHLQLKAQYYLSNNNIEMAWRVLLL